MNEAAIQKKVAELHEAIMPLPLPGGDKPRGKGSYIPSQGRDSMPLEDSIDLLRLKLKYLLFDLEATKRENRYLRQMLDGRPRRDSDSDGSDPKF